MEIRIEPTGLDGLVVIHQQAFDDARGFFQEVYRQDVFGPAGIDISIQQLNKSGSVRNVLRGLHFQWQPQMAKLMRVVRGRAFLVGVDIRKNSPTCGKWFGRTFVAENRCQLFGLPGFARGFYVLSDYAEIEYMCTATYSPSGESGILWNDPQIGIEWPLIGQPILSHKDAHAQSLCQWRARPESAAFLR